MSHRDVFVLGHGGMLGRVVARHLTESGLSVRTTRARYGGADPARDALIDDVVASNCSAVINCIGTTPGRAQDGRALFDVNALLPQRLAVSLGPDRLLIHASSDAVFDGQRGSYAVSEVPNASDAYGASKRLGELAMQVGRVVAIRCSIVGLEPGEPRGLLGWFLKQTAPVTGYTDHRWNGITTLTWAKVALRALQGDAALTPGAHQPACGDAVSKYELLQAAARVFRHDVPLTPRSSGAPVDRTLVATIPCAPIEDQLEEMRLWYGAS